MGKNFGFRKEERLCSLKLIGRLFTQGKAFYQFPLRVVYLLPGEDARFPVQAAFSVSKKNFRTATSRNFLKRRMKEAYRLNKPVIQEQSANKKLVVMFIYTSREILTMAEIEKAMKNATTRLTKIINSVADDRRNQNNKPGEVSD